MSVFDQHMQTWKKRRKRMGDGAVGRVGENYTRQRKHVEPHLLKAFGNDFFKHGLDFGCGWGRFTRLLSSRCGHAWAVDIFDDWVDRAASTDTNVTPTQLRAPQFPYEDGAFDLVADIMTLQSLDDELLQTYSAELKRVAAPGALVVSVHVTRDGIRDVENRATLLELGTWDVVKTTSIDDSREEYCFLAGRRL